MAGRFRHFNSIYPYSYQPLFTLCEVTLVFFFLHMFSHKVFLGRWEKCWGWDRVHFGCTYHPKEKWPHAGAWGRRSTILRVMDSLNYPQYSILIAGRFTRGWTVFFCETRDRQAELLKGTTFFFFAVNYFRGYKVINFGTPMSVQTAGSWMACYFLNSDLFVIINHVIFDEMTQITP